MTKTINLFAILFTLFFAFSCDTSQVEKPENDEKTITGMTLSIENGKDGYTAKIKTASEEIYNALISIPNLGSIDDFTQLAIGDKATLKGEAWKMGGDLQLKVSEIINVEKATPILLITNNSFSGIAIGDLIVDHISHLEKGELKNGAGSFEIYNINDEKYGTVGYILPDPKDENLVGNMVIQSTSAKTKEGIHVGSTFGDLNKKYSNIEVHGSEIEGRTNAFVGKLSFRLDTPNFTYDVDVSKIPASTKILEIGVNR